MLSILPDKECAAGWVLEEKPVLFTEDTLFDHINGEAELYFPYGFDTLATARYARKAAAGSPFVADVYRMGSLLDAFGIYSNYRKAASPACDVGVDCYLSSSQLLFYKDRFFVKLQATDTPTPEQDVFLACGRAIAAKLPPGTNRPAELEILNVRGISPKTERYIAKSVLGYPFFRRGLTADAVIDGERSQVFVVIEDSAAAARKAFDAYHADLNASGKTIASTDAGGRPTITASDPLYRGVYVEQSGRYLIGAIRLKDPSSAKPLVESLRARLGK
ncbi:MAG TPA: DUF6599 family protein [Syntrophales bacterium]|nr:DUF6599 family protein [Syntrophales bacterium]